LSTHQNHTLGFTLLGLNLLSTPHIARSTQLRTSCMRPSCWFAHRMHRKVQRVTGQTKEYCAVLLFVLPQGCELKLAQGYVMFSSPSACLSTV
jgi:hypothetical protein